MSQFEKLIARGMAAMKTQAGTPVARGGVTVTGVAGESQVGYRTNQIGELAQCDGMVTLTRADFDALQITTGTEFTVSGKSVRAVQISADGMLPVDVHFAAR